MQTTKIFITGCSRSGTTLLHRSLAAHSCLCTLPETDFFGLALSGHVAKNLARLGLVRRKSAQRALRKLAELAVPWDEPVTLFSPSASLARLVNCFVDTFDGVALEQGKQGWIEKTPKHFQHIGVIQRHIPEAHFIHVVRNGEDVVASIYDRATRYPDIFGARQRDLQHITALWNEAVQTVLRHVGECRHHLVVYESFCQDPEAALQNLCRSLGLEFEPSMLVREGTEGAVTSAEQWKSNTGSDIVQSQSKFTHVFSLEEQEEIRKLLRDELYLELLQAYQAQTSYPERFSMVCQDAESSSTSMPAA